MSALDKPFLYVASATGLGGRWQGSYGHLIQCAKAGSFSTVLLMDRYATKQQVTDIKAAGLGCWAWETPGAVAVPDGHEYHLDGLTNQRFTEMGYDGVVLQTENPDQRDGALRAFQSGLAAGRERHVVTYYFGFDDGHGAQHWADLKAAGATKMHVEHYAPDHTNDTAAYVWAGTNLGIPREDIVVVFGVYRGEYPDSYRNTAIAGRGYGCYIVDGWADEMTDPSLAIWKAWGGVNKTMLINYWRVIDRKTGTVLREERANTRTLPDGSTTTGLQICLQYMEEHLDTLRGSGDIQLLKIQR